MVDCISEYRSSSDDDLFVPTQILVEDGYFDHPGVDAEVKEEQEIADIDLDEIEKRIAEENKMLDEQIRKELLIEEQRLREAEEQRRLEEQKRLEKEREWKQQSAVRKARRKAEEKERKEMERNRENKIREDKKRGRKTTEKSSKSKSSKLKTSPNVRIERVSVDKKPGQDDEKAKSLRELKAKLKAKREGLAAGSTNKRLINALDNRDSSSKSDLFESRSKLRYGKRIVTRADVENWRKELQWKKDKQEAISRMSGIPDNDMDYVARGLKHVMLRTNPYSTSADAMEKILGDNEEKIASGKMNMEQAIELALIKKDELLKEKGPTIGKIPTGRACRLIYMQFLDEAYPNLSFSEKNEYIDAILDPVDSGQPEFEQIKTMMRNAFLSITRELVQHCLEDPVYMKVLIQLKEHECRMPVDEISIVAWESMCKVFYTKFAPAVKLNTPVPIKDPVKYYEEVLKQYVAQSMINSIQDMDTAGVFDMYKPKERPLLLFCFQKHIADLFPQGEFILDYNTMVDKCLAPKDAAKFNPFGDGELIAHAMFWSFSRSFSLFGSFFRDPSGGYNYYWIVFDRQYESVNTIFLPPKKNVAAPEIMIEEDPFEKIKNNVDRKDAKIGFRAEVASSETLNDLNVNEDIIYDPSFVQDVKDGVEPIYHAVTPPTPNTQGGHVKVTIKGTPKTTEPKVNPYDKLMSFSPEHKLTDEIAEISINTSSSAKSGSKVTIEFYRNVTDDERMVISEYIGSVTGTGPTYYDSD